MGQGETGTNAECGFRNAEYKKTKHLTGIEGMKGINYCVLRVLCGEEGFFPQRRKDKGKGKRDEGTRDLRLEAQGSEFVCVDL